MTHRGDKVKMHEMDTWMFRVTKKSRSVHILPVAELEFFQPLGRNKGSSVEEVVTAWKVGVYEQYW